MEGPKYIYSPVEITCKGKWVELKKLPFITDNGKKCVWEYISRPKSKVQSSDGLAGAAFIPFIHYKNKQNKIALVINYRPALQSYNIEFPAGMIDKDETFYEAAKRELLEETGL